MLVHSSRIRCLKEVNFSTEKKWRHLHTLGVQQSKGTLPTFVPWTLKNILHLQWWLFMLQFELGPLAFLQSQNCVNLVYSRPMCKWYLLNVSFFPICYLNSQVGLRPQTSDNKADYVQQWVTERRRQGDQIGRFSILWAIFHSLGDFSFFGHFFSGSFFMKNTQEAIKCNKIGTGVHFGRFRRPLGDFFQKHLSGNPERQFEVETVA
jgi:hypothetical protein